MGNKHPAPGGVYIISKHNGHAIAKDDEHQIITTTKKEPRGDAGWRIFNVPNDENIGRLGFNTIAHNKDPKKYLACDDNGNIITVDKGKWNSSSGWKIIQQRDTNIYQLACHNGYWLTMNDNGEIKMLKKHQLANNKKENWILEYISNEDMNRKVPKMEEEELKQTEAQMKQNEEIIQNILNRQKGNNDNKNDKYTPKPHKKDSVLDKIEKDDGYDVDDESDEDQKERMRSKIRQRQHTKNVYDKRDMDKKFELLTQTLSSSMQEITASIKMMRTEIVTLKTDMKKMEQKAQIDRGRIKEKLDILTKSIQNKSVNTRGNDDNNYYQHNLSEDRKQVKEWLSNAVGFSGYYNNFIQNGFDSLKIIQRINEPQQLEDIGIKLKGHQLQIMAEILQLQQNSSQCHYI